MTSTSWTLTLDDVVVNRNSINGNEGITKHTQTEQIKVFYWDGQIAQEKCFGVDQNSKWSKGLDFTDTQ